MFKFINFGLIRCYYLFEKKDDPISIIKEVITMNCKTFFGYFPIIFYLFGLTACSNKGILSTADSHLMSSDILSTKLLKVAREIMVAANTCALITLDNEGQPRVRTMDAFDPEEELIVWFGTNPRSRKIQEIQKNNNVTLYYLDGDDTGYVTIHGEAHIVNNPSEKERHWKEEWHAFYPNKNEDYVLIKVVPSWLEVISETRGILGDPKTWQPPRVYF